MPYDTTTVPVDLLRGFIADIYAAAGCATPEAEQVAHHLLSANLTGHDSHGVIRTPRYVQWLQEGKVLAGRSLTVVQDSPTHAIVDGNYGLGQTIGPLAVDFGIARAKQHGLAVVGLRNSGHLGRIGDWGERAAAAGLISLHSSMCSRANWWRRSGAWTAASPPIRCASACRRPRGRSSSTSPPPSSRKARCWSLPTAASRCRMAR